MNHTDTVKKTTMPIAQIALANNKHDYFDYLIADEYLHPKYIGCRVKVTVLRRELVGVLCGLEQNTVVAKNKLKPILSLIDEKPVLSSDIIQLCRWISHYYHAPLGDILISALPQRLRRGLPQITAPLTVVAYSHRNEEAIPTLNTEQATAVTTIKQQQHQFHCFLLQGVTGSGKTEVYFRCLQDLVTAGKQVLILVPEIGLTPQMAERIQARFSGTFAILHSGLNETERLQAWSSAQSGDAKIVIGTRSAVLAPLPRLAMIIIDEEHDASFKQLEGVRYHARDVAIMRAQKNNIPIILGSATPSLESLHNANCRKFTRLSLSQRAGVAQTVKFELLDLRSEKVSQGLSTKLLHKIDQHLNAKNQVLLFLNRRGFAPVILCQSCRWIAQCRYCDMPLTLHTQPDYLQCHHCGHHQPTPSHCLDCNSLQLAPLGMGTERIERVLQQRFPQRKILRIDRDSTRRKNSLSQMLEEIHSGAADIMLGTQMLAKGHHFANVTLVGIIDTDSGFFCSDFRACERLGQLILQVAGRAGRAEKPGEVVLQTYLPEHPLLNTLLQQGYPAFSDCILQERQQALLPPHGFLALFRTAAKTIARGHELLEKIRTLAEPIIDKNIQLLGPVPAPHEKRAGRFRAQLLIKSTHRSTLQSLLSQLQPKLKTLRGYSDVKWTLDVDPSELT